MVSPTLFDPGEEPSPSPAAPPPESATGSLYRRYRPQSFAERDLVGQEPVVRTLRNAIRLGRVAHAYLFCGPRGTGKTTTARLLAKAVNCLDPDPDRRPCNRCRHCVAINRGATTDIVEIDAASNRGIDDIRDLRERVKYAPAQLRVKFYIVDEAHQITGAAANAFLKTLEEPPAHTIFVLATTDPEELLPTIVSRCQRFDFRRIALPAMVGRLRTVADEEGIVVSDEALAVVARHATGSLRDALGLLDQLALFGDADGGEGRPPIGADDVRALLGLSRNERVEALVRALADRDATAALAAVNDAVEAGEDPRQLSRQLVGYLRQLLFARAGAPADADDTARTLAERFALEELAALVRRLSDVDYRIKHAPYGQLPLELALVEATVAATGSATAAPRVAASPPPPAASGSGRAPAERTAEGEDPPTTRLQDRVRGVSRAAEPAADKNGAAGSGSAGGRRSLAAERPPESSTPAGPAPALQVEQLVELWPRIRQDVKAVNRRIEALLSSVDPAHIAGSTVTLATPYPFHRDKLNADEVRQVVEAAISRLVGATVQVACVLHEEANRLSRIGAPVQDAGPAPPAPPPPTEARPFEEPTPAAAEIGAQRVQAAKNIFDAEEID